MKKLLLIVLASCFAFTMFGHSGKAKYHVIIDTDGGIDDLRAISMLLASKETEVIGIYCSDGVLSPTQTAVKVQSMLTTYHHEGIPVGIGNIFLSDAPANRHVVSQISWGSSGSDAAPLQTDNFLKDLYQEEPEKITLVCLASLNTVSRMHQQITNFSEKTERILWFNESDEIIDGFNYLLSPEDFQELVKEQIPISVIHDFPGTAPPLLDDSFWLEVSKIPSRYASNLYEIHQSTYVKEQLPTGRMHIWDELASLYLVKPEIFISSPCPQYASLKTISPIYPDSIMQCYLNMLKEKAPDFKVFRSMPVEEIYYTNDISDVIQSIIIKHGITEWRAGILTNELHGHLGIYSIIGMKMGIRAREYFNIGLDDLRIQSMAGQRPPVSCMNDGLQVSTGSTMGHGLIQSDESNNPLPKAIFIFKASKIQISLKLEYVEMIRSNVKEAVDEYGLGSDAYWARIRQLAIEYWLDLDRNQIFNIALLK